MKHNAIFLMTTLSLLCMSNVMYGMKKEKKPNIYCEEDVTIVLDFEKDWYNSGYKDPDNYFTEITHNLAKDNVSFNEHMKSVKTIFEKTSEKKIMYLISAYLIASNRENTITASTQNYFDHAVKKMNKYHHRYYHSQIPYIKFYKIFYQPSHISNEQKKQNNIELSNTQINIVNRAIIDFNRNFPNQETSYNAPIEQKIKPLNSTRITKSCEILKDTKSNTQSIFLMDV
jgi:hypothetical protein